MNTIHRFEELMSRLAEGPLPVDDSIELTQLIEKDPSLATELSEQLETSEMIALSEDADREGSRLPMPCGIVWQNKEESLRENCHNQPCVRQFAVEKRHS